jgi:hypothetical protein
MGGIIDQHAAPGRHLEPEEYARESYIHWNGPPLHRADALLVAALNHYFKAPGPAYWKFFNKTTRLDRLVPWRVSQIIDRIRSVRSNLPFLEDPSPGSGQRAQRRRQRRRRDWPAR